MNYSEHTTIRGEHISLGLMRSNVRKKHALVGNWKIKDKQSPIILCSCGKAFLITRENQTHCLFCIWGKEYAADLREFHTNDNE